VLVAPILLERHIAVATVQNISTKGCKFDEEYDSNFEQHESYFF
jgi:hypothetical protein